MPHFLKKLEVEQDVWSLALERVRRAYTLFDHIAVSFSGGKDSTATLHVAIAVAEELGRLPVRTVFFDEECIPYQTEEYVRRVGQDPRVDLEWYCLPVQGRNACSRRFPWWYPWDPAQPEKWARPLPPEATTELDGFPLWPEEDRTSIPNSVGLLFPPRLGNVAMLLGIRADESITRYRAVARRRIDNYIISWGRDHRGRFDGPHLYKVYPIYDWTNEDVWTAPAEFGWDYNRAYDAMEMAGLSHREQRCSPPFGEEPLAKLWTFKECFPEVWDKMADRVPGASTAARYAETELYGFRHRSAPPEGTSWQDFITEQVHKHDPSVRSIIIEKNLARWIRIHYSHTADPILPTARHPLTGVSWEQLLMIAMRGDFRSRKQLTPSHSAGSPERERAQVKYDAERAALEAQEATP